MHFRCSYNPDGSCELYVDEKKVAWLSKDLLNVIEGQGREPVAEIKEAFESWD